MGEESEEENEEEEEEEDPSMAEEEQDGDVHYVSSTSLIELEKMHAAGNATKEDILAHISDKHEETLPHEEVMVPIKMEGHTEHFPTILDHVEPTAFLEKVMAGRNDPELKSMTLTELRAEENTEEDTETEEEEEEDGDVHYVSSNSLIELEKMHAAGNATKESILAHISDEHEETLPDEEVMVPIKMEGHFEHFPTILDHVEPTAFLEK